jgi:threonine dehydratase
LRENLDDLILASDQEMKQAVKAILYATGQVAELAGAASAAAAQKTRRGLAGKKVAPLLSGGNIEPKQLNQILIE